MHLLGLFLTVAGVLLQQYYLLNEAFLSLWVLVLSAIIMALGILTTFKAFDNESRFKNYVLLSIFLMYFSLIIMPFVRFKPLSGNDIVYEFMAAKYTAAYGWNIFSSQNIWYVDASHFGYLSSISVTILPAIISKITGLNLILVFKFILSAIISVTPILIYLAVKEIFETKRLAILSAIIFSEFYYSFWSVGIQGARQAIAILFILFSIYIIAKLLKTNQANRQYFLLLPFFLFGVIFSHYTMSYWLIFLLGSFALISFTLSKFRRVRRLLRVNTREITFKRLRLIQFAFLFSVLLMVWYFIVPSSPISLHFQNVIKLFNFHGTNPDIILTRYALGGSQLGPWVDNWLRFGLILTFLGFLLLTYKKKSFEVTIFYIGGSVFLASLLISIFIPNIGSLYGGFLRFYITGFFLFCTFEAIILLALDKKLKGFLLPAFLMLSLPMGLMLPAAGHFVLYNSEGTSPTFAVAEYGFKESEFEASVWAGNHIPSGLIISTDHRGYVIMTYANHPIETLTPEELASYDGSSYLYLHDFAVNNGLWQTLNVTTINFSLQIQNNNVIYNNDNIILTGP
jgi:uncharacterized membrane protein